MRVTDTALDGVKVLEYDVHTDCRGYSFPILRPGSPTSLQWVCVELCAENRRQILIPKGFGHAFLALEDNTRIGMEYPIQQPILAPHDIAAKALDETDVRF